MKAVFVQTGDVWILNQVGGPMSLYFTFRLFTNDRLPQVNDETADYTEATFNGYATKTTAYSAAFVNSLGKGQITGASFTWLSVAPITPAETMHGVFVTNDNGDLVYAQRFDTPIVVDRGGVAITYQPIVTAVTE